MKITAIEIKTGMIIQYKNDYWNVLKTQHVKPGKGGAFNQVELKSGIKGVEPNSRARPHLAWVPTTIRSQATALAWVGISDSGRPVTRWRLASGIDKAEQSLSNCSLAWP